MMSRKRARKGLTLVLALAMCILIMPAKPIQAADLGVSYSIEFRGTTYNVTKDEDRAWEVLDIINAERRSYGLDPLVMDKRLMETAMGRAAEITVKFDHTRPDGSSCFNVYPVGEFFVGENIAYGYPKASDVMTAWMNSPGHRQNILTAEFKAVGVGCVKVNGRSVLYWVQSFGDVVLEAAVRPGSTVYNGVDYSAVYDFDYYINKYSDMKSYYSNNEKAALAHFVNYGMAEGRQGCAEFNVKSYKNRYADLRKAFGNDLKKYYLHYINHGKAEKRTATGSTAIVNPITVYNGVDYSKVYDFNYYISRYSDIKKYYGDDDVAALKHFVEHGMAEGRQGSANFDVTSYKMDSPDLRSYYKNDNKKYYIHYMNYGYKENRAATGATKLKNPTTVFEGVDYSKVYNFEYYINKYSDMKAYFGNDDQAAIRHFVLYGMAEGRQGSANFDLNSYKNANPDLRKCFKKDNKKYYIHYLNHGYKEGRAATGVTKMKNPVTVYNGVDYSKVYDFEYYISTYSDMKKYFQYDDEGALRHFVEYGIKEGRQGKANFNVKVYRENSPDLQGYFGFNSSNNIKYVMHYINHGYKENRKSN